MRARTSLLQTARPASSPTSIPGPHPPYTRTVLRHRASTSAEPHPPSSASPSEASSRPPRESATAAPSGLLSRLLSPTAAGGKNTILSALGYYSEESRAIGAATTLYRQATARAAEMPAVAAGGSDGQLAPFSARFEMLSIHVYIVLRRLRKEKGAAHEANVSKAMQTLFDVFWTDVRNRMLIKEEGMRLISSGKWIKECEQRFFGMALAIDDCLEKDNVQESREELRKVLSRNITCLARDESKVNELAGYVLAQLAAHDKTPFNYIWEEGLTWS